LMEAQTSLIPSDVDATVLRPKAIPEVLFVWCTRNRITTWSACVTWKLATSDEQDSGTKV